MIARACVKAASDSIHEGGRNCLDLFTVYPFLRRMHSKGEKAIKIVLVYLALKKTVPPPARGISRGQFCVEQFRILWRYRESRGKVQKSLQGNVFVVCKILFRRFSPILLIEVEFMFSRSTTLRVIWGTGDWDWNYSAMVHLKDEIGLNLVVNHGRFCLAAEFERHIQSEISVSRG